MNSRVLTDSQLDAILSLPEHQDARIPTGEATNPASVYTDQAHFQLEWQKIFLRVPIPITPSAMLPEPNMAYAHDGFGVPVVLTRDREGKVHAFLNACKHRGSRVLATGTEPDKCGRLTCPYHAWSYNLQGDLVGLPRAEVFPTLIKSEHGLTRLPVLEAGGFIWVGLNPGAEPDFSIATGQIAADMDAFGLADMHVYNRKTYDLKANWKILIETFLETYHVPPVHKDTVAKHFAEVPTIYAQLGPHSRQTIGRAHFTREALQLNVDDLHKSVTHAYTIFPTAVLVTSPQHFNLITMMPRAANRTIVECYMLTRAAPDNEKTREFYDRTFQYNMTDVFGKEDFVMAVSAQEGLETGALENVRFGGLEEALVKLHNTINNYLAE
jgi:phenylpropionate dioxygenase-like ring-hydroxylating dioxygenase large terminal subunit